MEVIVAAAAAGSAAAVKVDGASTAAGTRAGVVAGAAGAALGYESNQPGHHIIGRKSISTFDTITTRKSFSFILREETVAESLRIFPEQKSVSTELQGDHSVIRGSYRSHRETDRSR